VSAFSKTDIGKAREYFDTMKSSEEPNQQPDVFAYNTMIGAYMTNGQFGQADALVKEMGQAGISANFITFKIIIEGLLKSRFTDDAWKMYTGLLVDCKEMSKTDFAEIHIAFVKAFCFREAMEIFHEMERRFDKLDSRTVYPALMYAIKKKDSDLFQRLAKKYVTGNEEVYGKVLPLLVAECRKRDIDASPIEF
jgi:pentatricopeptide repeat protein